MMRETTASIILGLSIGAVLAAGTVTARQITGVPGSPEATLTIDRPKLTPEDEKRLMEAQRKASDQ
jgi:hypothetical protein